MRAPLSNDALDQIFRKARTYSWYEPSSVSEAELRAIYDLVKMGPTSVNGHPTRIVWCLSDTAKTKVAQTASEANKAKITDAPVTAVLATDMAFHDKLPQLFPHTDARSWFSNDPDLVETTAFRNSSLQGAYFIMAVRALGLDAGPFRASTMTHWTSSYLKERRLDRTSSVPWAMGDNRTSSTDCHG